MIVQQSFQNDNATLYLIPTPIGNLEDITLRSLNTLEKIDYLFCEDKRVTTKLLNHFNLSATLYNYHEHNSEEAVKQIEALLQAGNDVGIVSDAGMPGISDPSFEAIKMCKEKSYNVVCLPGATAFVLPLIVSNFKNSEFKYVGFLNKKSSVKRTQLQSICNGNITTVFYESTHKIVSTLKLISEINDQIKITVGRELTKLYEEYVTGTASELINYYEENSSKGEFVVVIEAFEQQTDLTLEQYVQQLLDLGVEQKQAIKDSAKKYGVSKNEVYKLFFND